MDTKLKNRRKLGLFLAAVTILGAAFFMIYNYHTIYRKAVSEAQKTYTTSLSDREYLESFLEFSYLLYNQEISSKTGEAKMSQEEISDAAEVWMEDYEALYPYLDYRIEDGSGAVLGRSTANTGKGLADDSFKEYAFGMVLTYDEHGDLDVKVVKSSEKTTQSIALRKIIDNWSETVEDAAGGKLKTPKNRTYISGMKKNGIEQYLNQWYWFGDEAPNDAWYMMLACMAAVGVAAWILAQSETLGIGSRKVFQQPFEIVFVVAATGLGLLDNKLNWIVTRTKGIPGAMDIAIWIAAFAVTYWAASCVSEIQKTGVRKYVTERTLLWRMWKTLRKEAPAAAERVGRDSGRLYRKVKEMAHRLYQTITDIDFTDKSSKAILRIVLVNFIILAVTSIFWFYGIMALIIYSVILYFILKKYFNEIKKNYHRLLEATNEIADGNLDVEIDENLGVFEPFKEEIEKIQTGFKKAVDEEVKSQRMKTELVTNVSHDLKTPLTAIITYVNLLKMEHDPERQKEYIDVLDRKSLRLKALIEDLFEISKASSRSVNLNIIDMDIVNLFKQVKFEMEEKITEANLDFRLDIPEEKVIVALDGQKTYRIFENLIGNAVKYAMPHTRVYVKIAAEEGEAVFRMKNVSATELTFNPEEITERFVRGDSARNTEGSGLGLAIVKSFVEIQKGKFWIETEADLFKAEIRWKLVDKKDDIA